MSLFVALGNVNLRRNIFVLDVRRKIVKFMVRVQNQKDVPLWSLAHENLLNASALQTSVKLGKVGSRLYLLIKFARRFYLVDVFMSLVGAWKAFQIWMRVKKESIKSVKKSGYQEIFVGFGASSERFILSHASHDKLLRINAPDHSGVALVGCPSLSRILISAIKNSVGYARKLKRSCRVLADNEQNCLVSAAMNVGTYSFYCEFWQLAKKQGVKRAIFIAPDILAFACVDVGGIETTFIQHGLLFTLILMPKFDVMHLLTKNEMNYYQHLLPFVSKRLQHKHHSLSTSLNKVIMFLSINVRADDRILDSSVVMDWAIKNNFQVVVRPTPSATQREINYLYERLPGFELDSTADSLDESFRRWTPSAVVSWTSTGLATALEFGALPISLYNPVIGDINSESRAPVSKDAMIYPMLKKFIFWSESEKEIKQALLSPSHFNRLVADLREADENLFEEECLS